VGAQVRSRRRFVKPNVVERYRKLSLPLRKSMHVVKGKVSSPPAPPPAPTIAPGSYHRGGCYCRITPQTENRAGLWAPLPANVFAATLAWRSAARADAPPCQCPEGLELHP
jgi:hypothetical protein